SPWCVNTVGGCHASLRVLGSEGELDKQVFLSDCGDCGPTTLCIYSLACHLDSDQVCARIAFKQRHSSGTVQRFGKQGAKCEGEGITHRLVRFILQGAGERTKIRAAPRRGNANLRRWIGK